jgi:hypothetical protein
VRECTCAAVVFVGSLLPARHALHHRFALCYNSLVLPFARPPHPLSVHGPQLCALDTWLPSRVLGTRVMCVCQWYVLCTEGMSAAALEAGTSGELVFR